MNARLPEKTARPPDRPLRVGFVLARSFTLTAFALFVDTLRLAGDKLDRSGRIHCDWEVLASSFEPVTSSCGTRIVPDAAFGDPRRFDYVAVVGGLLREKQPLDAASRAFVSEAAKRGVPLIGLCTGSFVLAALGLIRGQEVCVSWLHVDEFRQRFPEHAVVSDKLFVIDGDRATCAGGSAAADLAAALIRLHVGPQAEKNALEVLQLDRARGADAPQPRDPLGAGIPDPRLRAALLLMEQHVGDTLSVPEIARLVRLSRRQMERLFEKFTGQSPGAAYAQIRLRAARRLVLGSERRMTDIALDTGFESPSHFSRAFRRTFGESPSVARLRALGHSGFAST